MCTHAGLEYSLRASKKLFTAKYLVTGNEYPHVSQKILKGAAARFVIYWLQSVTWMRAAADPDDVLAKARAALFSALAALLTVFAENGPLEMITIYMLVYIDPIRISIIRMFDRIIRPRAT